MTQKLQSMIILLFGEFLCLFACTCVCSVSRYHGTHRSSTSGCRNRTCCSALALALAQQVQTQKAEAPKGSKPSMRSSTAHTPFEFRHVDPLCLDKLAPPPSPPWGGRPIHPVHFRSDGHPIFLQSQVSELGGVVAMRRGATAKPRGNPPLPLVPKRPLCLLSLLS